MKINNKINAEEWNNRDNHIAVLNNKVLAHENRLLALIKLDIFNIF